MLNSSYKSYDDLPLFLNAIFGALARPSEAGLPGRGGATERVSPAVYGGARDVGFVTTR